MKIELYEKYELKSGQIGWTVDELGDGEAYIVELDIKPRPKEWLVTVPKEEIVRKIA